MTVKSATPNEHKICEAKACRPLPDVPDLPSVDISSRCEVHEALDHYVETITDFDKMNNAETADPVLFKAIEEAFTQARHAVYQQVDAHCAHVVARTLLADRKYRKEQVARRGSHKGTDEYIALLGNYARAVHCAYHAELNGEEEQQTNEWQSVKQTEDALDTFLETFYAEESGLAGIGV